MPAAGGDFSAFEHDDAVGLPDAGHPLRHHDDGGMLQLLPQRFLQPRLCEMCIRDRSRSAMTTIANAVAAITRATKNKPGSLKPKSVLSRVMRKLDCRLWLNEVNRQ